MENVIIYLSYCKIDYFSNAISPPNEVIQIRKVLSSRLGQKLVVKVSVPKGDRDEILHGRVADVSDYQGIPILIMKDVTCETNKNVNSEMYKIALQVICMIGAPKAEELPNKKAAV